MSLADFKLKDNEQFDNSFLKKDYLIICHQQGANLNNPDQNVEFIFGENNNYHQIGNAYLEFDITVRDTAGPFTNASNIRLIINALAYCFKDARLTTTGGSDLEYNKYVGQVSTIMRLLTSKNSDLSSCFDKSGKSSLTDKNPSKRIQINNHTDANKRKYKGKLELEHIFGFCNKFKKITKNLGFHLTFKTANLQDIIFTTIATDIKVTTNNLYLYVPILMSNTQTQVMFNESIMNNYTITFDSRYTERKTSNDGRELQVDIGSAQHNNSPEYLLGVFQTQNRKGVPNKSNNIAIFDTNHVTKLFVEIDRALCPRDGVSTNFEETSYLDQYRDLKLFYKKYVGEQLINP